MSRSTCWLPCCSWLPTPCPMSGYCWPRLSARASWREVRHTHTSWREVRRTCTRTHTHTHAHNCTHMQAHLHTHLLNTKNKTIPNEHKQSQQQTHNEITQ